VKRHLRCAKQALLALLMGGAVSALYAQGYVSKGKDGELIYSNKPQESVPASPVSMPGSSPSNITSYALLGTTLEDVQKDAALKGPVAPASGGRTWSNTTWNASWNYWTRQEANQCRIDVVSVKIKVATQLPAWSNEKDASDLDKCRWDAFAKTLRDKENARVRQVMARGRQLEHDILAMPPHPRCEPFAAEVAAMGQKLVDDGKPKVLPPPPPPRPVVAKAMPKAPPRMPLKPAPPVPPPPPKPLAISKAVYDACKG
jgi:predicted secreted Zn-dependent protease